MVSSDKWQIIVIGSCFTKKFLVSCMEGERIPDDDGELQKSSIDSIPLIIAESRSLSGGLLDLHF